jgi:hypothetical protein
VDPRDFDAIAKTLGAPTSSRRGALKLLVGATLGAPFGYGAQEAIAKRKRRRGTGQEVPPEQNGGTGQEANANGNQGDETGQEATAERKRKPRGGTGGKRVLLALYDIHLPNAGVDWSTIVYRPRQFANGLAIADPTRGTLKVDGANAYTGWDFFSAYNWSVHRVATAGDWLELQLNRAATLAIVWRGGPAVPRWLASWTKGPDVGVAGTLFPTYRKRFSAGRVTLGAVYDSGAQPGPNATRDTYWVLLAENDGRPSPQPAVPQGRERPRPNETCPGWVHDRYVATGPDGKSYPTWHPQIDPVYWCYHRHEHGSDPKHFSTKQQPLFGYVAAAHGMDEVHQGFKNFVFDDPDGQRWMVTHHFGTAGLARACNRFHTVGIQICRASDGLLLANLHFMGDFGRAVVNRTQEPLTPPSCPDQFAEAQADRSTGIRQLPAQSAGSVAYEPWRFDSRGNVLGLTGTFTVNNPDAIVICNNAVCDQPVKTGSSGSFRFFTPNDGFGLAADSNTGTFYTDAHGKRLVGQGEAGAVQQYVRPGVRLSPRAGHYFDIDAWGRPFVFAAPGGNPTNREGSLGTPN